MSEKPQPPSQWQRAKARVYGYYVEARDRLREALGGKCRKCGSTANPEFHHPRGRTWVANRKNRMTRMRLYWRDFRAGNLELLCGGCNKHAGCPHPRRAEQGRRRRRGRC